MMIFKTLSSEFTALRVTGGTLFPVKWTIKADLMVSDDSGKHEVAFQQMLYWITAILDSSFIMNIADKDAKLIAELINNPVMTLPGDPFDDLLTHVLIEKLNTIGKSKGLEVVGVALESEGVTCHIKEYESSRSILPDISYAGKKAKKKLKQPWWKRNTSEISDLLEDEEHETISIMNPDVDVLNRFGDEIEKRLYPSDIAAEKTVAKVIEPEWTKPK